MENTCTMKNIIRLFLVLALLSSCRSKKTVLDKIETVKSDTLIVKSETVVRPPILSSLTINEICDTLTGKPKVFKQVFVIDGDTLELSLKNNELTLYNNQLKKTISKKDSVYEALKSEVKQLRESVTIKYRIPLWAILTIIGLGAYSLWTLYSWVRRKFF